MTVSSHDNCFLCQPNQDLVVATYGNVFSMVGLGPITERYLMIAAKDHVQSFADFFLNEPEIAGEIEKTRAVLEYGREPLLMTEHGRVPACLDDKDEHDAHCFHAHVLLFQSTKDIEEVASGYFMKREVFGCLSDALAYAAECQNYHLLSPNSNRFVVLTGALNVPRQFFRQLVAIEEDQPELADWRHRPHVERALANAERERTRYGASG